MDCRGPWCGALEGQEWWLWVGGSSQLGPERGWLETTQVGGAGEFWESLESLDQV